MIEAFQNINKAYGISSAQSLKAVQSETRAFVFVVNRFHAQLFGVFIQAEPHAADLFIMHQIKRFVKVYLQKKFLFKNF